MFAIAFDLLVRQTEALHPKHRASVAYDDIAKLLKDHGFEWTQGSVYLSTTEDLSLLFAAMNALKTLPWFAGSVRDIRAFRVEQWSDFTSFFKGGSTSVPAQSRPKGRSRTPSIKP